MTDPVPGTTGPLPPDPSRIVALATGYWASAAFLTACRLRVFTLLGLAPLPAEEVAAKCGAHPRPMARLLNACVGLGLLHRQDDRYANSADADAFLVEGKPAYLGSAMRYSEDLYPVWGRLEDTVRTNRPALVPETILGADPDKTRNFVLAMDNRARGVAAALAATLDLSGRHRLLDVGGGPGTYSTMLVRRTPGLHARVLDLPAVAAIARDIVAASGVGDRVSVVAGDYRTTPFADGNDVVLFSGMMHRETDASCRALLARAFESLVPGGLVVVSDVFFDDDTMTSPPFATLFALTMMLTSEDGAAHPRSAMAEWLRGAGFTDVTSRPLPPPMPHTVLLATRP
jgi:predicted O-methyltransferase YrrM